MSQISLNIPEGYYAVLVKERHFRDFFTQDSDGCWVWNGQIANNGYGKFYVTVGAHRVAYQLYKGPIPDGFVVDHLCRNKKCVNPAHLEAVSCRENLRRGNGFIAQNIATTHCPRGHEYSPDNTYKRGQRRVCKICERERSLKYYREVYRFIRTEKRRRNRGAA